MDYNEFKTLVSRFRDQGLKDEQIMDILLETYETKVCSLEDFEIMVGWLGYKLSDIFYEMHGIKRKK